MRVAIPDEVKSIIEKCRQKGDYVTISERICGKKDKAMEVANAVRIGSGEADVVREICVFYKEKEVLVNEINSI